MFLDGFTFSTFSVNLWPGDGFRWVFSDFWLPLGHFFWFLRVLETGLKFDDFSRIPWGDPSWEHHPRRVVRCLSVAYSNRLAYHQFADLQKLNHHLLICKHLKADTRLANWQLQTSGLEMNGNKWKTWLSTCDLNDLNDLGTVIGTICLAAWWP